MEASDISFVMSNIARTWRFVEPNGTISDEHIDKMDLLHQNVSQRISNLKIAFGQVEKAVKSGVDEEEVAAKFEQLESFIIELQEAKLEYVKWFKALSDTYFKMEYDI